MTISFTGQVFHCVDCNATGPRGRLTGGRYTDWCVPCTTKFKKQIQDFKANGDKLWFCKSTKGDKK